MHCSSRKANKVATTLGDLFIGVPVRLGKSGVEEIIEVDLNGEEMELMNTSAEHVQDNLDNLQRLKDKGEIE